MSRKTNRLKNRLRMAAAREASIVSLYHDLLGDLKAENRRLKQQVIQLKDEIQSSHITLSMHDQPMADVKVLRMKAMTYSDVGSLRQTLVEHAIHESVARLSPADVPAMLADELTRKLSVFMERNGLHFKAKPK